MVGNYSIELKSEVKKNLPPIHKHATVKSIQVSRLLSRLRRDFVMHRSYHRNFLLAMFTLALAALSCNAPTAPTNTTPTGGALAFLTTTAEAALLTPAYTETPDLGQPTATIPPGVTPSATICSYNSSFVTDVTIPDGTEIQAGTTFDKTWRVRNNGCAAWPAGTLLVFFSGDQLGASASVPVPATAIDATADISVSMTAPTETGEYVGYWQLQAPDGGNFGPHVFANIVVVPPDTPTPNPTATTAVTPSATPAYLPFVARWQAQDQNTTNITRLEIHVVENVILVHMWNQGVPSELDRGETSTPAADANDGVLYLSWVNAAFTETQQLTILLDGRLQINGSVNYSDPTRADLNYTQYFVKQP